MRARSDREISIMNFVDLPVEIVLMIFSNVNGKDLSVLRLSSSYIKSIIDDNDLLWSIICKKEFDIANCSDDLCCTYELLYKYLLFDYGYLIGIWIMDLPPYGGLSKIMFTGNGITFFYLKEPTELEKELVLEAQMKININANNLNSKECIMGYHGPHDLEIEMVTCDRLMIRCKNPSFHRHPEGADGMINDLMNADDDDNSYPELLLRKFFSLLSFENSYTMRRYIPPLCPPNCIIKPGMFMGGYGGHGVEFVCVKYDDDSHKITVEKLTGDPNVPANEITITVDLDRPMVLNETQQKSLDVLCNVDTYILPPGVTINTMSEQPFIAPTGCDNRDEQVHSFRHCKARFHSKGQIAGHGFLHPKFIEGHFIIFDDDTFCHIWLSLKTLSLFKRVDNV